MGTPDSDNIVTRPTWNRRNFLVDKRFQYHYFRICFWTGMMVMAVSVLMFAALTLFFAITPKLHPEIFRVIVAIPILISCFCVAFGVVTVRMTHKVAGQAFGLERSINRFREGDLDTVVRVRNGDYLKNIAGALEDLRADLLWHRGQLESLRETLQDVRESAPEDAVLAADEALERTQALLDKKDSPPPPPTLRSKTS